MGVKKLEIVLQSGRDIFYAGEVVSGICEVETDAEIPCIEVKFHGLAYVHWTETRSHSSGKHTHTSTVHYTASMDLFNMEQHLSTSEGKIPSGIHQMPFAFQLPQGLVTSFEGAYGYIRYRLFAQQPANWLTSIFKTKAIKDIKVLQWIDTNLPQYQFAVAGTDTKTACCLCCASGPLLVEAQIDRAAYCPNEIFTVSANFRNSSSKNVKPYAKLVQKRLFRARGKTRTTTQSFDLFPMDDPAGGNARVLEEGGMASWNGMRFRVPECLPSINGGIIEVNYYVEVGLNIPWAFDLEVYLPVVIGTIPFRGPPPEVPVMQQPMIGLAQTSTSAGMGRWTGSGKQSGIPPASAPPLPSPTTENVDFSLPPPSYFATVFGNETPKLAQADDEEGQQSQQQQPTQQPGTMAYSALAQDKQ